MLLRTSSSLRSGTKPLFKQRGFDSRISFAAVFIGKPIPGLNGILSRDKGPEGGQKREHAEDGMTAALETLHLLGFLEF